MMNGQPHSACGVPIPDDLPSNRDAVYLACTSNDAADDIEC